MPPAARVADMHTCPLVNPGPVPHVGGPILPPGCPTVLIGMMPAARVGDMCVCVGPPDVIAKGSPTVLIGGMMAARIGDLTAHGGVIVMGFPTVIIGEAGMGGGVGPGGGGTPKEPGLFEDAIDVLKGMGKEVGDMAEGIYDLLTTDPRKTAANLRKAITHPKETWNALKKPYEEAIESGHPGEALGRGIVAVGSMFLGVGEAGKAGEAAGVAGKVGEAGEAAGKVGRVTEAANTAEKVAEVTTAGGKIADAAVTENRIAKAIDLMAHENKGGHLLERHVGRTEEQLAKRLQDESKLKAASTFANRAEAESATARAFDHNSTKVDDWVKKGAKGQVSLDAPWAGGSVLKRGATASIPGTGVRIVLRGDGSGGYYILTGHPTVP